MKRLQDLIEQIKSLEKELFEELQKKQDEFYYKIRGKRVRFEKAARRHHKTLLTHVPTYLVQARLRNVLTVPIVWACFPPALLMDVVVSSFQYLCFPIYGIPQVKRGDYIVVDRHSLAYLNIIEKVNCLYCGYFNGLAGYVQEIGARTEQYWCPIKHARRVANIHSRYNKYLEYGDGEAYKSEFKKVRSDFDDLTDENDK